MTWLLFIFWCDGRRFCSGTDWFCLCPDCHVFLGLGISSATGRALLVFASVWSHVISLSQEQTQPLLSRQLVLPYLIAGLIGVPLGTYLLQIIQADTFKMVLGLFLVLWCPMMLLNPQLK